jgi:uncharacterized protein (TIGR01777 family)
VKVVITGGSGFLGRPLARALRDDGHDVAILTRGTSASFPAGVRALAWTPDGTAGPWAAELDGAGAVVNLAGESIAARRWTAAQKTRILDSRILATRSLALAIAGASTPPPVFVSGSAVGYYGPREEITTEATPAGTDFLAQVAVRWEAEAMRAAGPSRVVTIRTGVVLDKEGGALAPMLLPFRLGLGGRLGSGRQYFPWIHRQDWIDLVRFAIETPGADGPLNATAPHPVTNAEFTRALAHALGRPALVPAPAFALRLVLGEMADALLLTGQRAVPAKAERLGFTFTYKHLDDALRAIFAR